MAAVDLIEDSPPRPSRPAPSTGELRIALEAQLVGRDLTSLSLKGMRRELEQRLGFPEGGLDTRRDELKALAQEFAQAAAGRQASTAAAPVAAAPMPIAQAAAPQIASPGKRKSLMGGLAGGTGMAPAPGNGAAPAADAAAPAAKRKMSASPYILWCADNRARIMQELQNAGGAKPTFGESNKAISDAWKQVAADERAQYEQKAAEAKAAEPPVAKVPKVAGGGRGGSGRGGGWGRGRGAGKDTDPSCSITRAEFLAAKRSLQITVGLPGLVEAGVEAPAPFLNVEVQPRFFKSGAAGWYASGAFDVPIAGQGIVAKVNMNIYIPSSKFWADGEGLAQLTTGTSGPDPDVEAGVDGGEQPPAGEASLSEAATAQAGAQLTTGTSGPDPDVEAGVDGGEQPPAGEASLSEAATAQAGA